MICLLLSPVPGRPPAPQEPPKAAGGEAGRGVAVPAYAVRCRRESKVAEWDYGTFEDCNDDKEESAEQVLPPSRLSETRAGRAPGGGGEFLYFNLVCSVYSQSPCLVTASCTNRLD